MGILLVYDVTDERSFNSKPTIPPYPCLSPRKRLFSLACEERSVENRISQSDRRFPHRHSNVVLERRTACHGRREQDPDRQQVRLGGQACRLYGTRAATRRRTGDPVHGGLGQEQHQRRESFLQFGGRHQEADYRHE